MTPTITGRNTNGEPMTISAQQELINLRAENAMLKAKPAKTLSMKVSEKGGLSVYGLGRFPVTLYKQQWQQLLAISDKVTDFIKVNDSKLTVKE